MSNLNTLLSPTYTSHEDMAPSQPWLPRPGGITHPALAKAHSLMVPVTYEQQPEVARILSLRQSLFAVTDPVARYEPAELMDVLTEFYAIEAEMKAMHQRIGNILLDNLCASGFEADIQALDDRPKTIESIWGKILRRQEQGSVDPLIDLYAFKIGLPGDDLSLPWRFLAGLRKDWHIPRRILDGKRTIEALGNAASGRGFADMHIPQMKFCVVVDGEIKWVEALAYIDSQNRRAKDTRAEFEEKRQKDDEASKRLKFLAQLALPGGLL